MDISLAAEPIFHLGSFPVTNTLMVTLLISLLLIGITFFLKSRLALVPKGLQNLFEYVLEAVLDLVDSVTQDRKQTEQFFPLIATIFLFVILCNWIELVPGLGTIGLREIHEGKSVIIPFIRSSSADLNVTAALAVISVFTVQFMGIAALGFFKYAGKFLISPFHKPDSSAGESHPAS